MRTPLRGEVYMVDSGSLWLEEIEADIRTIEQDIVRTLSEVTGGGTAPA